jgi:hypothetical protein
MNEHTDPASEAAEAIDAARTAEGAIQRLCRATLARPSMTPGEVDVVLAHLAAAAAAFPQATRQLGDILEYAKNGYVLEMDTLTDTEDPDLAIDTSRLHLDATRDPALDLHRPLDAAHNETAHIATADREAENTEAPAPRPSSSARRPEDRRPPSAGSCGIGPTPPR